MPLGSRDILLILRARNEAGGIMRDAGRLVSLLGNESRTTAQNMMLMGAGLTAVGVAFTAAGAAGTAFFAGATGDAIEYRRQAALTVTQIDEAGVSIDQIGAIAKRVAKEVPAPFEEMQSVLYDIFSSMDVSVAQSETLLKAFAKEAVAGQVGIQEAGRSTMAIMNSFKIPVQDVNKVLDLQFQLVRKGVGTFAEFSEVIGRVTPAAVAAGQSVESMAGMLAFLTRNGLSTAMASTSAARAMELMTTPKTMEALKKIGVHVTDANGNFLQMRDIIRQLVFDKGWGKMTDPQIKEAFKETFGTGSIQARRFFDLVIPNFQQFSDLTDDMSNSAGAMDAAYDIMFNQPAAKAQELSNRWEILKVNVGEKLIPVFEKLAGVIIKLMDAWEGLSPETQDLIIKIGAIASAVAVVVGVVTTIVGIFLMFAGAAAIAGVSLTTVGVVIAAIAAAFIVLVGIVYLVIQNWDTLVEFFGPKFTAVKDTAVSAWNAIWSAGESFVGWITGTAVPAIVSAWNTVVDVFNTVKGKIEEFIGWVEGTAIPFVMYWVNSALEQFNLFAGWWNEHVGPVITAVGELFSAILNKTGEFVDAWEEIFQFIWDIIQFIWTPIQEYLSATMGEIWGFMTTAWNAIKDVVLSTMTEVWNIIQFVWDIIQNVVKFAVDLISWIIHNWGDNLVDFIQIVWDGIKGFIEGALQYIQGIIQVVTGIISGDWGKVWDGIRNIVEGAWNMMWSIISSVVEQIANIIRAGMDVVAHFMGTTWENIWNTVQRTWENIKNAISNAINGISDFIRNGINGWRSVLEGVSLWDIGKKIIDGLWNGIKSGFDTIKNGLGSLTSMIPDWKGPPAKDRKLLVQNGQYIMEGLQVGLAGGWRDVRRQLMGYTPSVTGMVGMGGSVGSSGSGTGGGAITIQEGAFVFHIDNAKEDVERAVQAGIQGAFSQLADEWAGFGPGGTP